MQTRWNHLVAHARDRLTPLVDRSVCASLWARLRRQFAVVQACTLMPDHLHLITAVPEDEARWMLAHELSAFTRAEFPGTRLWQPVPEVRKITDDHHLRRQIRYVHLNPCRAGLTRDPLVWEWTTHRDAIGAAASGWIDRPLLQRLWGRRGPSFEREFHSYVAGDPTVDAAASYLPGVPSVEDLSGTIRRISLAVLHATRAPAEDLQRRSPARSLLVRFCSQVGTGLRSRVAEWAGLSPRAVRAALARPATPEEVRALAACRLLLGTPERFLRGGEQRPGSGSSTPFALTQRG